MLFPLIIAGHIGQRLPLLLLLLLLLFTAADCWVLALGSWRSLAWFAVGSHGETFYDDYCNSLPQTIITFHYENGGHIIT